VRPRRRRPVRRTRPAVALALAAATGTLALAAAAVAPTLVAAGDAATVAELARLGPDGSGFSLAGQGRLDTAAVDGLGGALADELGSAAGAASRTVRLDPVVLEHEGKDRRVRPVAGSSLPAALDVVDGGTEGGLVVPDVLADELGVAVGGTVTLRRGDRTTEQPVAGIAGTLDPERVAPSLREYAAAHVDADPGSRPLDLVAAPLDTALEVAVALDATVAGDWRHEAPALGSLADARRARNRMAAVANAAADPRTPFGSTVAATVGGTPDTTVGLREVVVEAEAAVAALRGPARAAGLAGQAVALAVVAAAARFAAQDRAVALRLAAVRGRSPARQGLEAAGRAALPMAVGATLGAVAAVLVVSSLSPGSGVPAGTALAAARDALLALVAAAVVVAIVTGVDVATTVRVGRRRRWRRIGRWPWEPAVLALAVVAYLQLRAAGGVPSGDGGLHPLVLAFPVLLLLGTVGLAVRGGRRALPALRRLGTGAPAAPFLAIRRLAAASGPGLLLAGAGALALGLVVYTAAAAASLATSVEEKAALTLGADAVAAGTDLGDPAAGSTAVLRGRGRLAPNDDGVDVLLVDPGSIADATGTAGRESDVRRLVASLDGGGERLPVVVAGGPLPAATVLDLPGFRVPVEVVEQVEVFPGLGTTRPLVVASIDQAAALAPPTSDGAEVAGRWWGEVWAAGPDAADRLVAAGADPAAVRTAADAASAPRLVAVTWGLAALQAFAVLATALALAGVLLFVASRQRATQVSYALARRMGLRPAAHRSALAVEVVLLLSLALVAAVLLGLLAAALVAGALDPLPDVPPAPRATVPLATVAGLVAVVLLAGAAGAAALQRGADRADVAEVLRGG
jgi:hypothetical protein